MRMTPFVSLTSETVRVCHAEQSPAGATFAAHLGAERNWPFCARSPEAEYAIIPAATMQATPARARRSVSNSARCFSMAMVSRLGAWRGVGGLEVGSAIAEQPH